MELKDIVFTDKMREILKDDSQFIYLFGATGTSKTITAGLKFIDIVLNSSYDKAVFFIISKSVGVGIRNIVKNPDSIYETFKGLCYGFTNNSSGTNFKVAGKTGEKIVFIIGADNKQAESKLRGSNFGAVWIEEATTIHEDTLREAMGRTVSRKARLIATSNGGYPDNVIYTEFVNKAIVKFEDNVPLEELEYFDKDNKISNMAYYHFNIRQDSPFLSEEVRQNLYNIYPVGSFFYKSKILGVRGYVEGAAYADILDNENKTNKDIPLRFFKDIVASVDIGSSINKNDGSRSATVVHIVGITKQYQRAIVLDSFVVEANSHDYIIEETEKIIYKYWIRSMYNFKRIIIDSAEAILINTWASTTRFPNMLVKGAVKSFREQITLVTRCQLKQQLVMQKRLIWHEKAISSLNAHLQLVLEEDGSIKDMNIQANDFSDSLDYAITEFYGGFVQAAQRRL